MYILARLKIFMSRLILFTNASQTHIGLVLQSVTSNSIVELLAFFSLIIPIPEFNWELKCAYPGMKSSR